MALIREQIASLGVGITKRPRDQLNQIGTELTKLTTKVKNVGASGTHALLDTMGSGILFKSDPLKDYEKERVLGSGKFGQVWLVASRECASSKSQQQKYALKVQSKHELIEEGQAEAAVRERKVMSELDHPFLCTLVSSFQDKDRLYLVMTLIQGVELFHVLYGADESRLGGIPEPQARFYAAALADGLSYMHAKGYAYRDLKPQNVMIGQDGYPSIVDFGFTKKLDGEKTFTLCGTPLYFAPEILTDEGHNQSVDSWAFGVLIYEMLTGDSPFWKQKMGEVELFRTILKVQYEIPPNISEDVASLIRELVKKDPTKRLGLKRSPNPAAGLAAAVDHEWFVSIDFEKLAKRQLPAPALPTTLEGQDDCAARSAEHLMCSADKTAMKYPRLRARDARIFRSY